MADSSSRPSPQTSDAATALEQQLAGLDAVRSAHAWHPMFLAWKDRTAEVFQQFLPESALRATFLNIQFAMAPPSASSYAETESRAAFAKACEIADDCLKSALAQAQLSGSDTRPGR